MTVNNLGVDSENTDGDISSAENDSGTEGDGSPLSKRVRSSLPPLEAAENRSTPAVTVAVEGV
jgi:hypothetical protein